MPELLFGPAAPPNTREPLAVGEVDVTVTLAVLNTTNALKNTNRQRHEHAGTWLC